MGGNVNSVLIALVLCPALCVSLVDVGWSMFNVIWEGLQWSRTDPEVFMNVTQLITSKGYPCEEYNVHTEDGYILGIQRIPRDRSGQGMGPRPVVLLQHGLLSSSADWVDNLVNQSLAFLLADTGFDVWLGNSRGNTYARRHERLDPESEQFWNFSWDEMARYDLPATIKTILGVTGADSLSYVGHSQGTETMFARLSQDKDLAVQVRLFVALAPVAYLDGVISPIRYLAPFANDIELLFKIFGVKDFLPNNALIRWLARNVCDREIPVILCENIFFILGGYDEKQLNKTRIPVYTSHSPAGTSVKTIVHYAQSIDSGKFQMFNYGPEENIKIYNQTDPPTYDPSKVPVPVVLFSGTADWLAVPDDVTKLKQELPNVVFHNILDRWEHLDFIWAMDSPTVCYDDVIDVLKKYSNLI